MNRKNFFEWFIELKNVYEGGICEFRDRQMHQYSYN